MNPLPVIAVSQMAHTLQSALPPVFLIAGIAGLLNVMTGRLGRAVDRARRLASEFTPADHPDHARQVWELRILDRRIMLANVAIQMCAASAALICAVVAGMFVATLAKLGFARTMAVAFIVAMLLLILGLALFIIEVRTAAAALRVEDEYLERRGRR
ncbi:DUF2721 domain-containing protein [Sphingomonas jatrophae]|nr:DUF2721 domain-containing protein [Sphingomonas jatrophae]